MKNYLIFFAFFLSIFSLAFYSHAEAVREIPPEILKKMNNLESVKQAIEELKKQGWTNEEISKAGEYMTMKYLNIDTKKAELDQLEYNPLNYIPNDEKTRAIMKKEIRSIRFKPYAKITDPYLIVLKLGEEYYLENHRYCDNFETFAREKKIVNQQPFIKACLFHNHLRMLRRIGTIKKAMIRYPSRQWFDDFFAYMLIDPKACQ